MNDDALYDEINRLWADTGLMSQKVLQTTGWQSAAEQLQEYWNAQGRVGPPMGPKNQDTWWVWIHRISHTLAGSHSPEHAGCELEIARIVVEALLGPAGS